MAYQDLPPSYSAATGQHASFGGGLCFVDFLPNCIDPGGFISRPQFEAFGAIVTQANEWLRDNPAWEAKTCESVEFKESAGKIKYQKLSYSESGKYSTSYIRGLRLWIVPRPDVSRPPQEIAYFNLVPEVKESPLLGSPTFVSLNEVINKLNAMLKTNVLPGRIITVESQEMKVSACGGIDADRSFWTEHGSTEKLFVFVIRVFYEKGPPAFEEVGVADFTPTMLHAGGLFSHPQFELFSSVVARASQWCALQSSLRFCNAQSVEIKLKSWKAIDTQRMSFTEHGSRSSSFIRILRVVYCKSFASEGVNYPPLTPPLQLTCKTFKPLPVKAGLLYPKLEDLSGLKERVEAWIKVTGARVLSAETVAMRLYSGQDDVEASYTYNYADRNEYCVYVIRVYLDGHYTDPPAHMLPPVPVVAETSCTLS